MASAGSRSSCPTTARPWWSRRTTPARRTRPRCCARRSSAPVAGPPLRELAKPGHEGRDLHVRRHARPAAGQDDPRRARGAGRARRGRRDPRRHRHAPRQHRRGDPRHARRRAGGAGAGRQPRRARQVHAHLPRRARARRAGVDQHGVGRGRPADHDRLRGAALLRRLQRRARSSSRPAWPGWTRCWCCTTRPGSATRARRGARSKPTPSTPTSAPRPPPRRRTSRST